MAIIWKRLIYHKKDYGDYYLISNVGEIKGVKTGKIRRKNINHEGYYFVSGSLGSRESKITFKIHRAVAETFISNPDALPVINHKDGNKLNNSANNLEWCTYQHNSLHAQDLGLIGHQFKSKTIICLNTKVIFDSVENAANWCNCACTSITDYLNCRKNKRKSAGKHPITQEPLQWMYYDDYLNI